MIRLLSASLATAALTTGAMAGGIDRSGQSTSVLFEPGNYVEFSFGSVNPAASGVGAPAPAPTPGATTGDVLPGYGLFGTALKFAVNDKVDTALIFDQPFGADLAYPTSVYFASSATALLRSNAFTGIARYKFNDKFSVYGGLRQQSMKASAMVPYVAGYTATGANDDQLGYLVGAAYERPDIALRVALTYFSSVEHNLSTFETSGVAPLGVTTTTKIETPQAINLEFQTGIAPKTLLFGSIRWAEWSKFDIAPPHFAAITGGVSLVSFSDDRFTYRLGVGRQLDENWSIAGSVTHEPQVGGFASNLQPTDGYTSVGVGVTYRQDNMKLQAGLSHTWIGDATTGLFGGPVGNFDDNTALAFGMKVGFSF